MALFPSCERSQHRSSFAGREGSSDAGNGVVCGEARLPEPVWHAVRHEMPCAAGSRFHVEAGPFPCSLPGHGSWPKGPQQVSPGQSEVRRAAPPRVIMITTIKPGKGETTKPGRRGHVHRLRCRAVYRQVLLRPFRASGCGGHLYPGRRYALPRAIMFRPLWGERCFSPSGRTLFVHFRSEYWFLSSG